MAATPKHRRSSSKKRSTRASNRYDVVLNKARKIKKFGGSFTIKSKETSANILPGVVSESNPSHKGIKVIKSKKNNK